ncbi:MAG: septal ring lytic transglycosylase RlpA family protein [Epsilonproteobacteria bacterium]|nr:septal ring lytic transglycosylase RlpA family protein [Campylobacterota bacterium]
MRRVLLVASILLISGCSNLNPFKKEPQIYYIEGEEIEPQEESNTSSSKKKSPPIKATKYTSKARHKATMKPYSINGKVYKPTYVSVGDSMTGIASWYGPDFHGKQTSNGEYYNMYDMTVAHKTWPMDTMVKITNLDNGKSVVARINDRGPFVPGRVVDCSYAVAKKIGIDKKGLCNVRLDVVGFAGKVYNPKSGKPKPKVKLTNFGVQVGAFSKMDNAKEYKKKYEKLISKPQYLTTKLSPISQGALHRVMVMGFNSKEEAQDFIKDNNLTSAFIVRD